MGMMYGYSGGFDGAGSFSFLFGLVILADFILLGVFLWKHITTK
jgi:hypothetical protein